MKKMTTMMNVTKTAVVRMRVRKACQGLAIAALAIAAAASASAQEPGYPGMGPHRPPMERAVGPRGDHGRWWNEPRTVEKYKLTDAQRKSMDDIYQQHRLTLVDLHGSLEKAELALEPLIQADQPEEGKILSQIDRVAQARAELEKANARMLLGIRKELTPEQWKQIHADRAARRMGAESHGEGRRWGGEHRGSGPNGGPGAGGPPPQGAPAGSGGPGEDE
jgi:periplasmic protein CpxP/Spy